MEHQKPPAPLHLVSQNLIEEIIRVRGPVTAAQIAQEAGLSQATVRHTLEHMLAEQQILPGGLAPAYGERLAQTYLINKERYALACVYYQEAQFRGTLISLSGEILLEREYPADPRRIEALLFRCIDNLLAEAGKTPVLAIGLGVPGVVRDGTVTQIPQIPAWEGAALVPQLRSRYQRPIIVENDVNLAAVGVYRSLCGAAVSSLALLYLDSGTGCGLILERRLFYGSHHFAGEVGGLPTLLSGRGGSFEAVFSALRDTIPAVPPEDALSLRERLLTLLAQMLRSLCCLLDPEVIALSCSLLTEADLDTLSAAMGLEAAVRPRLILVQKLHPHFVTGLTSLCLSRVMPTGSIFTKEQYT